MAIKGLVLVKTEPKSTQKSLSLLPGKVLPVSGRFDAILAVEAESPRGLADFVLGKVRQTEGVINTETLITVQESIRNSKNNNSIKAVVLISTNPAKTNSVFEIVSSLNETDLTLMVTGPCDIVSFLSTLTIERLSQVLLNSVRTIDGVTNTETLLVT